MLARDENTRDCVASPRGFDTPKVGLAFFENPVSHPFVFVAALTFFGGISQTSTTCAKSEFFEENAES
jgi:hypothetical protein